MTDDDPYGRIENPHVRRGAEAVRRIDPKGVRTIIDAGCGTGQVTALLLEHLPDAYVIALDNSRPSLADAAARLSVAVATGRVELVHADLNERLRTGRGCPVEGPDHRRRDDVLVGLGLGESGQEHRCQDRNDGDDDQQLD